MQGDMIPWTVGQQFQDPEFPLLSGARIVRIAAHPEMARAGYGTKAVQLLRRYYQGELASLDEEPELKPQQQNGQAVGTHAQGQHKPVLHWILIRGLVGSVPSMSGCFARTKGSKIFTLKFMRILSFPHFAELLCAAEHCC